MTDVLWHTSRRPIGILIAAAVAISAHKERSISGAALREQGPERGIEQFGKIQGVHGGALVDFGSDLIQSSLAPQCGQIYRLSTVGMTFETSMSPSRYLTTASRFLLFGDRRP